MFASSNYPDQAAADRFVAEMRHGTLIACTADGYPQVSILPFVKTDDVIELHCVQADLTFEAVRANPRVTFFVSDFLAWSPHTGCESAVSRATFAPPTSSRLTCPTQPDECSRAEQREKA